MQLSFTQPTEKNVSIVKSVEERLQLSVDDFRKLTWLEWLSLLHSDYAESELGCVQFHTCQFIGRNVAVLSLCQTYNDAKEHKIIIFSPLFFISKKWGAVIFFLFVLKYSAICLI